MASRTKDLALQFGAVDRQRLLREGAVADQHAAATGAEASSLEAEGRRRRRAPRRRAAAVAGGVDDGAARRHCVTGP